MSLRFIVSLIKISAHSTGRHPILSEPSRIIAMIFENSSSVKRSRRVSKSSASFAKWFATGAKIERYSAADVLQVRLVHSGANFSRRRMSSSDNVLLIKKI